MERLWAPWRMTYIENVDKKESGCVFCELPQGNDDRASLILYRGERAFVVMNLYPYNNGHLMVVPFAHAANLEAIDEATALEMWRLEKRCVEVLTQAFRPDGFNVGMNLGRVAGAGIDQHLHLHIVPRWNGDTNFMAVVGETKVISQGLQQTYDTLAPAFGSRGLISRSAPDGK